MEICGDHRHVDLELTQNNMHPVLASKNQLSQIPPAFWVTSLAHVPMLKFHGNIRFGDQDADVSAKTQRQCDPVVALRSPTLVDKELR